MSSRDQILKNIKSNKPDSLELPIISTKDFYEETLDLTQEFIKKVEVVGGNVFTINSNQNVIKHIEKMFPETQVNFSTLEASESFNTIDFEKITDPKTLEDLDVLVLESHLGVAENGAVWLDDKQMPMRVSPFITKHLVFLLKEENILGLMHQAYEKITTVDYGVFISGPSKTADIEQSLVIGAHGALSLNIIVIKKEN